MCKSFRPRRPGRCAATALQGSQLHLRHTLPTHPAASSCNYPKRDPTRRNVLRSAWRARKPWAPSLRDNSAEDEISAAPQVYRPEQSAAKLRSHSSEGVFEVAIAGHRSASVVNVTTTRSA